MAFKYNKTQFNWDRVKQHLLNQGNISVDIQDLQQDILKAFNKEIKTFGYGIALVQFSLSVMSNSLRPHELQHARPLCPSPNPGVHSDSRPSSQLCHPAISSSVVPLSSCPQSLTASESFPMSQLFA